MILNIYREVFLGRACLRLFSKWISPRCTYSIEDRAFAEIWFELPNFLRLKRGECKEAKAILISHFFHSRFSLQQPLPFDILGNYFKRALQSQLNFLKCCCGCFDKIPFCNEMPLQFTTRKIAIKRINEWNSK